MSRTSSKWARESSPASEAPHQVQTKLSAFEERYETELNLMKISLVSLCIIPTFFFWHLIPPCRIPTQKLDLNLLYPLQGTSYNCGEQRHKLSICLLHISLCIPFFSAHSISWGNRNTSIILTCKCKEDSMTNLVRHIKTCKGQVVNPSKSIASYVHGSTYNKAELQYLISHWVFECHRLFAIINDPPLQCILKTHLQKLKILTKEWEVLSQLTKILSVCNSDHFCMIICANIAT